MCSLYWEPCCGARWCPWTGVLARWTFHSTLDKDTDGISPKRQGGPLLDAQMKLRLYIDLWHAILTSSLRFISKSECCHGS